MKVNGWGWFYLSAILDDCSRYIIDWKLCTAMTVDDVKYTLQLALDGQTNSFDGLEDANIEPRLRLLSDNGPSCIAGDLAEWLGDRKIGHVHGAPNIHSPMGFPIRCKASSRRS